jgi:glycosidase
VQTCELDNLAEYAILLIPVGIANSSSSLATDTEYVRGRLATYVNDLLSLGVDGLRLDAAKREWSF